MAVALEQENRARYQEALAKVQEAEADVPRAMAEALRAGRLGALDYYNVRNVLADTDMRAGLAKGAAAEREG
jgi:uncharacterized protein YqfA (UPF0365 family)